MEQALSQTSGPFFLEDLSVVDCVFVPYVERMNASLFYYKGFLLRDPTVFPNISGWFDALESRQTYLGTQSDAHTHCHDLPPQMGGCFENGSQLQQRCKAAVDEGPWDELPDVDYGEPQDALEEALARVLKHREAVVAANCVT